MATALLQLDPQKRLGAEEAMTHRYFDGLPKKLLELPDGETPMHFLYSDNESLLRVDSKKRDGKYLISGNYL